MTRAVNALVSASSETRLSRVVTFIESFAPATEILVVGPSRGAVDDLVRRVALGRSLYVPDSEAKPPRATFGIHRKTLAGLMVELAAPRLAQQKRGPSSRLALEAIAKSVVLRAIEDESLAYFAKPRGAGTAADAPSFARALLSTLLDLRRHRVERSQLALGSPAERDLAVLLGLYENELTSRELSDEGDVSREAMEGAKDAPLARSPLALFDVALRSVGEIELCATLFELSPQSIMVVPRGDEATIEALRSLHIEPAIVDDAPETSLARAQQRLFSDDPGERAVPDRTVMLASAPSESQEMVEIARVISELAKEGVPFDAVAIALPSRPIYAVHLETALARASVPAYFSYGTRRPHAAGRALCALLACRIERFSARRFAEYLSLGQVPDERKDPEIPAFLAPHDETLGRFGEGAPPLEEEEEEEESRDGELTDEERKRYGRVRAPRRWERLLGESQTLEVDRGETGRAYYRRRLDALASRLQQSRNALERDDPSSPRIASLDRDIEDTRELAAFSGEILDACDHLPEVAKWEEWIEGCEALSRAALRKPEPVLAVLAELRALSGSPPVSMTEVLSVLETRLSELDRPAPAKRFGRVLVTTPRDLRGRSFRVVFVPGLTERVFPARVREDPLLVDEARRALSPHLATNDLRSAEERLSLLCAVGAATDRAIFSYPRVEAALGRPRVPSFYALDLMRATGGELPDIDEMQRAAARAFDARLDWPAPHEPSRAIDELEHDLSVLRGLLDAPPGEKPEGKGRYLLEENAHLARALRARFSRFDRPAITQNDGLVRPALENLEALRKHSLKERAFSASSLQLYSSCPYKFYLSAIVGLAEREDNARIETLEPATRGELFHDVAARLTTALLREGKLPVARDDLDDAKSLLRDLFARAKTDLDEAMKPILRRVFEDDCAEVLADLEALLASDLSESSAFVPIHADLGFGVPKHEHLDAAGTAAPVRLAGGHLLRGAIDAIEKHRQSGALRVTDYKTGVARDRGVLSIGGGEELQPVLYSMVIAALRGTAFPADAHVAEARLAYATKRGSFEERVVRIDRDAERRATLSLDAIDSAINDGFLLARPRKDACKACSFRPVCGSHEEARTARKVATSPSEKRHLDSLSEVRRQP